MKHLEIPYDKRLHILAGFIIAFIFSIVFGWLEGLTAGIIAGVGKEVYDKLDYGLFDIEDMITTFIGSIVGVAFYMVLTEL